MSTKQPWHKRPNEPMKAFGAFREYLLLGHRRTHREVAETLGHSNHRQCEQWSADWDWVERCLAYDQWVTDRAANSRAEAVEAVYDEIAKRAPELAEKLLEIAMGKDSKTRQLKAITDALDRLGAVARKELEITGTMSVEKFLLELSEEDGEDDGPDG